MRYGLLRLSMYCGVCPPLSQSPRPFLPANSHCRACAPSASPPPVASPKAFASVSLAAPRGSGFREEGWTLRAAPRTQSLCDSASAAVPPPASFGGSAEIPTSRNTSSASRSSQHAEICVISQNCTGRTRKPGGNRWGTDHPTAQISRTTVYRVLETLARAGVVRKVCHPGTSARYELEKGRHHHLVCLGCERMVDLEDPSLDGLPLPSIISGFRIKDYSIQFRGLCSECARKRGGGPRAVSVRAAPRSRIQSESKDGTTNSLVDCLADCVLVKKSEPLLLQ